MNTTEKHQNTDLPIMPVHVSSLVRFKFYISLKIFLNKAVILPTYCCIEYTDSNNQSIINFPYTKNVFHP